MSRTEPKAETSLHKASVIEQNVNHLLKHVRTDLEGRFNEVDILRRQWNRIRAYDENVIVPPFEVLIHPSSACNLLCAWCIGDHIPLDLNGRRIEASKQNSERLPDQLRDPKRMQRLIQGIIDYRKEVLIDGAPVTFSVQNIQFSGLIGEPLASRDAVLSVIPMLTAAKIRTGLFTNALLINDKCVEVFQDIDYINVSVDAGRSDTYNLLKSRRFGVDLLRVALDNIAKLTTASRGQSRLVVNASFVMFPENFEEVFLAASLLKDRGVRSFKVKQDISGKRLLTTEQAARANKLLDQIDEKLVDETFKLFRIHQVGDPDSGLRRFSRCRVTDLMAAVGSDGNLYPCNYHPRPGGAVYGSAVEKPFQEVWESGRRMAVRGQLPHICPEVCDPFKNRSNALLEALSELRGRLPEDQLRRAVQEAILSSGVVWHKRNAN